jgi:putative hydrolase of the HAD superfamily
LAVATTQLFRVLSILNFELYPDSLSTLQALQRHYRLGLVSDAQRVFSEPELQMTGLEPLMEVIIISSDHWFNKPDPRMFTMALDQLKLSASQTVYVGDSLPRDIFGAQQAGIYAVYLNRQHHTLDSKVDCRPQKMIHTLDELRDWLLT